MKPRNVRSNGSRLAHCPILSRENKYLVMAALATLGKLNAANAIEAIIPLTRHPDHDIRRTAAEVLGEIEG